MIVRNGDTNLPERLKTIRRLVDSNSKGIFFLNEDGRKSELPIESAKLVEYTDDMLTLCKPVEREPNKAEKAILHKWDEAAKNHLFLTYQDKVRFFKNSSCPHMHGEKHKGLLYIAYKWTVKDYNKRSDVIDMQYKLYR